MKPQSRFLALLSLSIPLLLSGCGQPFKGAPSRASFTPDPALNSPQGQFRRGLTAGGVAHANGSLALSNQASLHGNLGYRLNGQLQYDGAVSASDDPRAACADNTRSGLCPGGRPANRIPALTVPAPDAAGLLEKHRPGRFDLTLDGDQHLGSQAELEQRFPVGSKVLVRGNVHLNFPARLEGLTLVLEGGRFHLNREAVLHNATVLADAVHTNGVVTLDGSRLLSRGDLRVNQALTASGPSGLVAAGSVVLSGRLEAAGQLAVIAQRDVTLNGGTGPSGGGAAAAVFWSGGDFTSNGQTRLEGSVVAAGDVRLNGGFSLRRNAAVTNPLLPGGPRDVGAPVVYTIDTAEVQGASHILSPLEKTPARSLGTVHTVSSAESLTYVMALDPLGEVVALDFVGAGKAQLAFNAENSALSLVLGSPVLSGWSAERRLALADAVRAHPSFGQLTQILRSARRVVRDQQTLPLIDAIALQVGDAYADGLGQGRIAEGRALFEQGLSQGGTLPVQGRTPRPSSGKPGTQRVEENFDVWTLLQALQRGNEVTVFNRGFLAVEVAIYDSNGRKVGSQLVQNPSIITGVAWLDFAISAARGDRKAEFKLSELPGASDPQRYRVVVSATSRAIVPGAGLDAKTLNAFAAFSSLASLIGFGAPPGRLDAETIQYAAQSIEALVTGFQFADAVRKYREDGKSGPLFEAFLVWINEFTDVFRKVYFGDSRDEAIDEYIKRLSQGLVKRAATAANASYALAQLVTLYIAYENEKNGRFPEAVVTNRAWEDAGIPADPNNPAEPDPSLQNPPAPPGSDDPGSAPAPGGGTGTAASFGDPHLSNFDNFVFSFQAVGEFVLTKSTAPGDTFEVQARYTPIPGSTEVSGNAAVAMRVVQDRVGLYASKDAPPVLRINGEAVPIPGGGFFRQLPFGGYVVFEAGKAMVVWPDGTLLEAELLAGTVGRVKIITPDKRRGKLVGLLGNFDGDNRNDFVTRGGAVLPSSPTPQQLYQEFGESWRIRQAESLFDYGPGEDTHSFTDRSFPPRYVGYDTLDPAARERALQVCRQAGIVSTVVLTKCVIDVAVTGNDDWALISAGVDPRVRAVTVAPFRVSLVTGAKHLFGAIIPNLVEDREVEWTATGGTITRLSGNTMEYTAPDTPGTYTLTATLRSDPSVRSTATVTVVEPLTTIQGETRFILRWGENPRDLDAHLWLPESKPYHVYYGRKGSDEVCPFASLDVDDVDGFGPEVIKVRRLSGGQGYYQLWVHNFSRYGTFNSAQARVEIVDERGVPTVIEPPANAGGSFWWHVLNLDAATGQVILVNEVKNLAEPYFDTSAGCNGNAANLAARTSGLQGQAGGKPAWTPGQPYEGP